MLDVTIGLISNSPETIQGLAAYLRGAVRSTQSATDLADADRIAASSDALFLFADDFDHDASVQAFTRLRAAFANLLLIVITDRTEVFSAPRAIVLPRPAWGWMLLDAVRTGLGARA